MKKSVLLFLFLFILNFSTQAQGRAEYRNFFTEGSFLILENNYSQALKNFLEAYEIDSSNANINYKIGFCYLQTVSEKNRALPYLEKAVVNISKKYTDMEPQEKAAPINAYYYYGQALYFNYRFDEAIASYENFKSFLSAKQVDLLQDANRQIEITNNAKTLIAAPINVIIKNLGDSINSPYPDYSPVVAADEKTLIFTSRRPGSTGGDKTDNDSFYEDIYISYKKGDSIWSEPISISPNINTFTHEASVGLSADAQTLLIYKDSNGGDIYYSTLDGYNWTVPQALGFDINTPSWETSACISPNGNTLYFVSNRKGGLGGRDIWKCIKLPNGNWSQPQNVGAPINTPYDEESPFIHPSGNVLFFSSQGHKSIGGFDIFFSNKGENSWEEPLNIGYPINTMDDDLYYVTSPDGKRGYYCSSSRLEGLGDKDIYMISIPEQKEQALVLIKGVIIPALGDQLPSTIQIIATNNESGIISGTYTPLVRDGSFTIIIPPNSNYTLSYQNNGEEFYNEVMEVSADAAYKEINKVIRLKHIILGESLAVVTDSDEKNETEIRKDTLLTNFISIKGKLLDEKNQPFINSKVNLLNAKEEILQTTTTDDSGYFTYTNVSKNENYVVALENDSSIIGKKSFVELKDEKGKAFKIKNTSVKIKPNPKLPVKDITVAGKHEQLAKVDKLNFQMDFKYNVTQVDVNDAPFKEFIDNLMEVYNKNGTVNINLISSASQVPTRAYKSNKELAIVRAEKAKDQLLVALKDKGIDPAKINFGKIKSYVSGPPYNTDYLINKAVFERYQYIKVSAY